MNRVQKILTGLLIVQLVLTGLAFWPRSARSGGGEGDPLFPEFDAAQVRRITLETADQRLVLERRDNTWVLPDIGDYPALESAVTALLDRLQGLKATRLIAEGTGSYYRLQVAETQFARRVTWETQDGQRYTLYIGTSIGSGAHVRRADQTRVYQADNLNVWSFGPDLGNWINTLYLDLPVEKLTEITLQNPQDTVRLVYDLDVWRIPNRDLPRLPDQARISSWVSSVAKLRMAAPLGTQDDPSYQLDAPQAVLTFKTLTETVTLSIGAAIEGGYVAKASNSPYYVRLASYTAETILNKRVTDFLVDESLVTPGPELTPTPESAPTPEPTPTP